MNKICALLIVLSATATNAATLEINFNDQLSPMHFAGKNKYFERGFVIGTGDWNLGGGGHPYLGGDSPVTGQQDAYNGTLSMLIGTHSFLSISHEYRRIFSVLEFDVGEFGSRNGQPWSGTADSVKVTGYKENGEIVNESFDFDKLNDGSGPNVDYQTFSLNEFSNLYGIVFEGVGSPPLVHFHIDNIIIDLSEDTTNLIIPTQYMPGGRGTSDNPFSPPSPVPLGSTGSFLLIALGFIAGVRIRRRPSRAIA
jgi:hypothetical protein